MRRLHRAERGPELDRGNRTIHSMTPQSGEEHFNAAFVRAVSRSGVPRLTVFCRPTLQGSDLAARSSRRVDASGRVRWKADTGIDRFKLMQILPDARSVGFTGTGPLVANKISKPILVGDGHPVRPGLHLFP